jgi:L-aminopeptidase/D-esterase-like protein
VAVGYTTLVRGEGPLVVGQGPVRTGVTAVLPQPHERVSQPVFAGYAVLNGAGEMTGMAWIAEAGRLSGPVTITNTHSCGVARDATLKWLVRNARPPVPPWWLPVAAETADGYLNDMNGFHVREEHVLSAIDSAAGGRTEEGSVGGGTGMVAYEFKGGSGTSSRVVTVAGRRHTVGVFVQANFGRRQQLMIAGVPVGRHLTAGAFRTADEGSIIAVVATDAPLLPHQLTRLARRAGLGVGRSGSTSGNGSGDIFLAFSTANLGAVASTTDPQRAEFLPEETIDPLFSAVVRATDEAIVNAMVASPTMTGRDGHTVIGIPHDELRDVMRRYVR